MSAIAGVWYPGGRPGALRDCDRVSRAQALYGPHRDGLWDGGEVALGHRLMRFLPEDRFDRQPLLGKGGRLALVADCRIDNREELGRALGIAPAEQALMCDAAFILAALERWGEGALDRLNGDFAFAAWDADNRTLLLARDHLDGRPLHYHAGQGWFAFASMPKGLLALPDVPTGPDPVRLATWQMLQPLVGSRSFYKGVSRVEPGHLAVVTADGQVRTRRHWDAAAIPLRRLAREEDYADGLREALDLAVKARLRNTGGTAMMLSGGLDSAAVATSAAPLLAAEGKRLTAFTSVPLPGTVPYRAGLKVDEGPQAALVAARHPNIDHRLVRAFDAELVPVIEKMIFLADQPVMNPANTAWMHLIYAAAGKEKLPVVLSGIRGNMALTYTGEHLLAEHARRLRWFSLWRDAGVLAAEGVRRSRAAALRSALRPWIPEALPALWRRYKGTDKPPVDLYPVRLDRLEELGLGRDAWKDEPVPTKVRRWQEWSALIFSLMDGGPLNAAANAGYGVDRRDPTADRRVLEFCLAMPADRFLRGGRCKDVFRRAFDSRIPAEVLDDRLVGLQAADWKEVFLKAKPAIQEELARQAGTPACTDLVDLQSLRHLAETLETAQPDNWTSTMRFHLKLARGLSAGLFTRRASGGNA